ncbi:unnamed protein product [Caenorhabditis angaria]|uniref:Uncharacterized protein n=1 Tax=Caenorhabditis angaria TaxID=860376 RepID=A0A9P1MXQ3_9PELO|nr:unnamed protein product [Caenorhabditis angaria]
MCKKVDNNVEICNFIKAVRFLAIISVIWLMLGMVLVVFCLVVGAVQLISDKEDLNVEISMFGYIGGWMFALIPFLIAGFLVILIFTQLLWLYIIGIISGIAKILMLSGIIALSFMGNFRIPIFRGRFEMFLGMFAVILVELMTVYTMFVMVCSRNSEIEEESGDFSE